VEFPSASPALPRSCSDRCYRYRYQTETEPPVAAVKKSSLARELRESFFRLDLEYRREQEQEQERRRVAQCGAGDDSRDEQDIGGRRRLIDVEASLSVRLRAFWFVRTDFSEGKVQQRADTKFRGALARGNMNGEDSSI